MSEEQKDLELYLVVEDGTGRQLLGEFMSEKDGIIELKDPLLIVERVMQAQGNQQQIMLNVSPIMHSFTITSWKFRWSGYHIVTDEKLKSTYEKFNTQIRAARSGLSVANGPLPPGGPIQLASN